MTADRVGETYMVPGRHIRAYQGICGSNAADHIIRCPQIGSNPRSGDLECVDIANQRIIHNGQGWWQSNIHEHISTACFTATRYPN